MRRPTEQLPFIFSLFALADFFNALMVIPNVLALLALSHVVVAADRKAEAITKNVTQAYRAAEEK